MMVASRPFLRDNPKRSVPYHDVGSRRVMSAAFHFQLSNSSYWFNRSKAGFAGLLIEESKTRSHEHAAIGASAKRISGTSGRAAFNRGHRAGLSPGVRHFEIGARDARGANGCGYRRLCTALLAGGK